MGKWVQHETPEHAYSTAVAEPIHAGSIQSLREKEVIRAYSQNPAMHARQTRNHIPSFL